MNICVENYLEELKKIISKKAKYQKVMLVYDENVSNVMLGQIYDSIKTMCVFNKTKILEIDENEIFNGYRVVIYVCDANNFLKCKFDRSEFVNIFIPQTRDVLPFFLTVENKKDDGENYLLLNDLNIDISMLISVTFNNFYNYFNSLLSMRGYIPIMFINEDVTFFNVLHCMDSVSNEFEFLDVDIIKNCNICCEDIWLLDLILIDAFLMLINAIKTQNYMLVDVYKVAKENENMIDKFYKMFNSETFKSVIMLNYNCLYNYCLKTKQKIMEYINVVDLEKNKVYEIINKTKQYAKNDDGLMAYLYLYDMFKV